MLVIIQLTAQGIQRFGYFVTQYRWLQRGAFTKINGRAVHGNLARAVNNHLPTCFGDIHFQGVDAAVILNGGAILKLHFAYIFISSRWRGNIAVKLPII